MKTYLLLTLALLLMLVQSSFIANAGTPVFSQVAALGRVLPKLTTAPDGRIVLTFAEREGTKAKYFVSVSDNKGITFSTPKQVVLADFGAAILQRQPYVVMDGTDITSDVQADSITREPCQYTQFYDYLGRISTLPLARGYVFGVCTIRHTH